ASGLTLVFGVLRIINFAHGAFFMLGAYGAYQLLLGRTASGLLFIALALLAPLGVAALGFATERALIRWLYRIPRERAFLATFALLLIIQGAAYIVFGAAPRSVAIPVDFGAVLHVAGGDVPFYNVVLLVFGAIVAAG